MNLILAYKSCCGKIVFAPKITTLEGKNMYISPIRINTKANFRLKNYENKNINNNNLNFTSRAVSRQQYSETLHFYCPYYSICSHKDIDTFTGLYDKNCLLNDLKTIVDSKQEGQGFSVAMFDMDNFKSVNELLGYTVGDTFIKIISDIIKSTARSYDLKAYRFGGEEFVVLFNAQNEDIKDNFVTEVLKSVNSNQEINSHGITYMQNAGSRLIDYSLQSDKIDYINSLEANYKLLKQLENGFESDEARQDPYFLECLSSTEKKYKTEYLALINERLESADTDEQTKSWLSDIKAKMEQNEPINEKESYDLKKYISSVYDKSYEIYKLSRWMSDYKANNGFSITGGIVEYSPQDLTNKTPLDIITEVGEELKQGKQIRKGRSYVAQA